MNKEFSCIIADDDEVDRLTTLSFVRRYPFLKVTGVFDSAEKVLEAARENPPDALLLDIDMPGMNGLELRKQLEHISACIFITSYPGYALESYETVILDFIVKPLKADRFATTMARLENYLHIRHKAELLDYTLGGDTIFIKDGHEQVKIQLHEIIYLEALRDYTSIVTLKKKYCVLSSITALLEQPAFRMFIRIHRSYAVQKHFVSRIMPKEVVVHDMVLPVGRSFKDALTALK